MRVEAWFQIVIPIIQRLLNILCFPDISFSDFCILTLVSRLWQGCILLIYLSVISSKFIQQFAQKCQYFTLIDQSVPPDNCYVTCLLREKSALNFQTLDAKYQCFLMLPYTYYILMNLPNHPKFADCLSRYLFSNFSCRFLHPYYFFQFEL